MSNSDIAALTQIEDPPHSELLSRLWKSVGNPQPSHAKAAKGGVHRGYYRWNGIPGGIRSTSCDPWR